MPRERVMADIAWKLANRRTRTLRADILATVRTLVKDLFNPYRPERHYMRGPGPKGRARHGDRTQPDQF